MTETATPHADAIENTRCDIRLWDTATGEFVWSNHPDEHRPLLEFLAERTGWTLATLDWPGRGRVWSGRMRVGENGDVEARPESEFLAGIIVQVNPAVAPEAGSNS